MRKEEARLALLHRVATLYYTEEKRKNEIAKIINVSPTQVANLLREAKQKRIVDIKVNLPHLRVLQEKLRSKYHHLREVIVVPGDAEVRVVLQNLVAATAEYFDASVTKGATVALGGGYLMYNLVNALPTKVRDIHVYAGATVGRGPTVFHIDPIVVATSLWAKSGHLPGRAHYITVTPREGSRRDVQRYYRDLRKESHVRTLMDEVSEVDWVFASVGGLNADEGYVSATESFTRNLLDEMKFDDSELRKEGVVGDIIYSFFNESGNSKPTWDVVPSIGVKQLRQLVADRKKHVVIVVGSYKLEALRAILRGQLCNVLITDSNAALKITA